VTTDTRIPKHLLSRAAAVLRCVGHPVRLRLLEGLESGEKTVSGLQQYAGVSQPLVSQHLMVLKAHGIVDVRRAGSFAYYWIVEPKVHAVLECIRAGGCGDASNGGRTPW